MKAPPGAWGLGVQGLGFRALRGLGAPTRGALMGLGFRVDGVLLVGS